MKFEEFWTALTESMTHTRDYKTIKDQKSFKVTPSIDAVRVDSGTITTPRLIKKRRICQSLERVCSNC